MKKKTFLYFVLIVSLLNNSCRKNVTKIDSNYIGNWAEVSTQDCTLSIVISSNGDATSDSKTKLSDCSRYPCHSGTAKSDGKTLKIGFKKYKIVEGPTIIDTINVRTDFGEGKSIMHMKLDDLVLYKLIN